MRLGRAGAGAFGAGGVAIAVSNSSVDYSTHTTALVDDSSVTAIAGNIAVAALSNGTIDLSSGRTLTVNNGPATDLLTQATGSITGDGTLPPGSEIKIPKA